MYVIRPHGVSRMTFHCSFGVHTSGVRFWSLTASQPARAAPSTIFLASSIDPLWLIPISAITKTGSPSPTSRLPILTHFLLIVSSLLGPRGPPALPDGEAAIDHDVGSGEVARCITRQKDERASVLAWLGH